MVRVGLHNHVFNDLCDFQRRTHVNDERPGVKLTLTLSSVFSEIILSHLYFALD